MSSSVSNDLFNHPTYSPLHFSDEADSIRYSTQFKPIKMNKVIPSSPSLLSVKHFHTCHQYQLILAQAQSKKKKKEGAFYLVWVCALAQQNAVKMMITEQMKSWQCFTSGMQEYQDKGRFFYIYPIGTYKKISLPILNHRQKQLKELRFRERPKETEYSQWSYQDYTALIKAAEPVVNLFIELHDEGLCLGGFDPNEFVINAQGQCQPIYPKSVHRSHQRVSLSQAESNTYLGYSPPESYGYFTASPSPAGDVFSMGMWIFYAITGSALLSETRRPFNRLPSPHIYQPHLIPELVAVIRKATSSYPQRRYQHMLELWDALCWAVHTYAQRMSEQRPNLHVEIGHEIHIGLLKGQYNPNNQDDLFLGYQPEKLRGLFVVTDGVSISEYGTGDLASSYVRQEAYKTWHDISQDETAENIDEFETLSELSLLTYEQDKLTHQPLVDMINRANHQIGADINRQYPVFHGAPEGIMAATTVAVLLDRNKALLTSIGDSRIYLIRNQHICSLMVDDDLLTHLIQMGQTPTQAQQTPSSAALINCVGEFKKNDNNQLQAVELKPQLASLNLLPDDYLVLCSDGIPDYAGYDEEDAERKILKVVTESFSMTRAAFELIAMANRGGGGDNLSCIVLHFSPLEEKIS